MVIERGDVSGVCLLNKLIYNLLGVLYKVSLYKEK